MTDPDGRRSHRRISDIRRVILRLACTVVAAGLLQPLGASAQRAASSPWTASAPLPASIQSPNDDQRPIDVRPQETAQQLPRAEPNDHRTPAGQFVDGELRVELEAVEAEWYPRGSDGPRIVTAAFAEPGGPPQVPGPLIRAAAGTPVHVRVRNRLGRAITVRGLLDRAALGAPERLEDADPADADFFFADSLVVPAGETREVRFTPTAEVSSFYYGRRAPEEGGFASPTPLPGNFGDEGVFLGGLVVDPADVSHPPDERVFLITRWAGQSEPSTLAVTFKFMINGLSWPFTERLEHEVGDTVRWRLINASAITHPMHLHGFYFTVDGRGDTDADTVYAAGERRAVVTDVMPDFSSLRLTWVPERPGNWLFHCHLIRHMGALQRFAEEGGPDGEGMGGLVMGIVVRPRPGAVEEEPAPERTIHLWTSRAPDAFDGLPELSFVAREEPGAPRLDTTVVPGSPLVLERGQPTDIVVHNRLDVPISVHWHGLEVRSLYDGVGNWSGPPGATRPPIAPGDSARVHIAPPRAGTFIYHVHGETGHELSQGLYGPFLVLPEGEMRDPERDRVYVLAARGARRDPPPVVNGHPSPPPERFAPGGTYRLRFIHISPDARKHVRLLKDGEPVQWRRLAKDGADLPDAARVPVPAVADLGVGETFDAEWTPPEAGAYTLEVVTTHYSASGLPPTVQRIAFGVGEVSDEALVAAAHIEPPAPPPSPLDTMPAIDLDERELRRFVGTYTAPGVPAEFTVEWQDGGLRMSVTGREPRPLVPLAPTLFRWEDERTERVEFEVDGGRTVMLLFGMRLVRQAAPLPGGVPRGVRNPAASAEPDEWTDPSPHQVRFVTVAPDVRLEVLDRGGTGRPLVLLAGMMATAHTFDDFAPGLTERFRVLAVTRRGFGASSQPEAGYDLDTLVDDVRIVLDSLGIERAALLGHSFGAAEIVRFATLWPERVSHLVNVDGLMAVDPEGLMKAMGAAPT